MKVLIVSTVRFRLNGVTSVILNYYRNMERSDMQVDFVVHNEISDEYRQELEGNGSRIFRLPRKKNPLKNAKVVVRHSPATLKIALIVLILLSMAALFALRWVHLGILAETENLKDKAAALEDANADLEQKTEEIGSVQSVKDIAKEELGLVDPNTVIITPKP